MRRILAGILGFSLGFGFGWVLAFATFLQMAQADLFPHCERDCGLVVALVIGPVLGLICGIALAIFAMRKVRRVAT